MIFFKSTPSGANGWIGVWWRLSMSSANGSNFKKKYLLNFSFIILKLIPFELKKDGLKIITQTFSDHAVLWKEGEIRSVLFHQYNLLQHFMGSSNCIYFVCFVTKRLQGKRNAI